ncbi:MAG: MMPL family transporter [Tumebacillaceae bacterium]
MIEKWVRVLARARWLIIVLWIALTAASVLTLPNLDEIVRQTESKFVPEGAETDQVTELLQKIAPDDKSKSSSVLVMHRDGGLTEEDRSWLQGKVNHLNDHKAEYDIAVVTSAFDDPQLASEFESKDKTTQLVSIGMLNDSNKASTQEAVDALREFAKDVPQGAETYLTGSAPISKDFIQSSQDGMKKTETLTIALVLGILLIVFRSPIAPMVPLITIAMSFLISRGLVAFCAETFGLEVSSFTTTFLVGVLFGAGTDYCILLIHRYREELSKTTDRVEALVRTMQTVGKTVVFSGSTVLIAFFMIGFATFGLYKSAVGVAIGMLLTMLAGLTMTPALMLILGPKMFWPLKIKPGQGHGDSKLWGWMGKITAKRPLLVFLAATIALAPLILLFNNKRTFDDLAGMDQNIQSVQGFKVVENAFSAGTVLPMTLTLTSSESMRTPERLAALEKVSQAIAQLPDVEKVRSAARPLGQQLEELTIPSQLKEVNKGLGEINNGATQLKDGLSTAATQVGEGVDGIGQMSTALSTITEKQREMATGSSQIAQGAAQASSQLSQGAAQLKAGLPQVDQMQQGLTEVAGKTREIQSGVDQSAGALAQVQQGVQAIGQGITQSQTVASSMGDDLAALVQAHPELANDPSYQALAGKQQGLAKGLTDAGQGITPIQQGLGQVTPGLQQAAGGLGQLADAQAQIAAGVGQMRTQTETLAKGLQEASAGLNKLGSGASQISGGLGQIASGTDQMQAKVGTFQSGLTELKKGLGDGTDALGKMSDGLTQIQDVQQGMADNNGKQLIGWYLPESALDNADLKKAFDTYLSSDGKTTKLDVVLKINPYTHEAMELIDTIRSTVMISLNGSAIVNPVVKIGGQTAQYHILEGVSGDDFVRTGALILVAIYIVLALMLRSVLAPLYLLLSLGFSYLVTMGVVEWIFVDLLGHEGLSWTDAFFAFTLLVALGVDYSIFLMARFKEEYRPGQTIPAMQKAMRSTGGVIMSAAVIMGGTFGAMIFSGVDALIEIGSAVVVGLAIYTTIVMGLIVPALAILFGEANWWPLKRAGKKKEQKEMVMDL